jgi:hypothetical protein
VQLKSGKGAWRRIDFIEPHFRTAIDRQRKVVNRARGFQSTSTEPCKRYSCLRVVRDHLSPSWENYVRSVLFGIKGLSDKSADNLCSLVDNIDHFNFSAKAGPVIVACSQCVSKPGVCQRGLRRIGAEDTSVRSCLDNAL